MASCGRLEVRPDMFYPEENRGFRLLPKWFGRTLHSWVNDWVNAQLRPELEGGLDRFGKVLKRWDTPTAGRRSSARCSLITWVMCE